MGHIIDKRIEYSTAMDAFANQGTEICAYRASIFDLVEDPWFCESMEKVYRYYDDGLLIVQDGKIKAVGPAEELLKTISPQTPIINYRGNLIMPGFLDIHLHYPQMEMIGAYGEQLLDWLQKYTFPTEKYYQDLEYSRKMSGLFLKELFRNGTTTAVVFGTVHPESVQALFEEALKYNMRLIAGKVLMNTNAPNYLLDKSDNYGLDVTQDLITQWHKKNRLLYAVTPRFALTCSQTQLMKAGRVVKDNPGTYLHTHLSENKDEVARVKSLFPNAKTYLDVYHSLGLTGRRSIFAHCIHLSNEEFACIAKTGSTIAHCPTSNLFLGSGLFRHHDAKKHGAHVGLASDVGAGTSLSTFQTLGEAYKIARLQGQKFSPLQGFYLATLGSARALDLDRQIGNFTPGKEADFIVIDLSPTPLWELRLSKKTTLMEKLFVLMTIGDDRNIVSTYIMGKQVYNRK